MTLTLCSQPVALWEDVVKQESSWSVCEENTDKHVSGGKDGVLTQSCTPETADYEPLNHGDSAQRQPCVSWRLLILSTEPALLSALWQGLMVPFHNKAPSSAATELEASKLKLGTLWNPLGSAGGRTASRSAVLPLNLTVSTALTRFPRPLATQNACFLVMEELG